MLVAKCDGHRVEAAQAEKGHAFICPSCEHAVILKAGKKVVRHFAHKPPTDCTWAKGETREHLSAKEVVKAAFLARGLRAEVEYVVPTLPGDQRADVVVFGPRGNLHAIELQHCNVDLKEIERRARGYALANIPQIWIPFLRPGILEKCDVTPDGVHICERYRPRIHERWVHGFHFGMMWMLDPRSGSLWEAKLHPVSVYIEAETIYDENGDSHDVGGYPKTLRAFKKLELRGPFAVGSRRITVRSRPANSLHWYSWPAAQLISLVPAT